jgi:catechol 2,3-dioxygenase-like lactoylglutathione lyase family enzyme
MELPLPHIVVSDLEQALAFYAQLGFQTTYHDEAFAIVERDVIGLYLPLSVLCVFQGCVCSRLLRSKGRFNSEIRESPSTSPRLTLFT